MLDFYIRMSPMRSTLKTLQILKCRADELLLQIDDQDDSRLAVHELHEADSLSDSQAWMHESDSSPNIAAVHMMQPWDTLRIPGKSVITH